MINNSELDRQKDLVKAALLATDNYLGMLKEARVRKIVTQPILHMFAKSVSEAYAILSKLYVASLHDNYIQQVIDEMKSYYVHSIVPIHSYESFSNFIQDADKDFSEDEVQDMVNGVTWEDIYDLYDEDELIYEPDDSGDSGSIEEKISASQRIKKSQSMKRRKSQLSIARNLKLKRTSSIDVLKKRAVNAARRAVYKKLLMGRNKTQLSASEKDQLEKRMKNFKYMQNTIAIKMLPKLKAIEQSRLAHRTKKR